MKTPQIGLYALARALSQRGVVIKMQVTTVTTYTFIGYCRLSRGLSSASLQKMFWYFLRL